MPARRPAGGVAAVLALQRAAGNQATARLVRGRPGRRLARFAVAVETSRPPKEDEEDLEEPEPARVVERVRVGARPPGVFGSKDRSHTTSWETFCDLLRYEVTGKDLPTALARVEALYQFALALPVAARGDHMRGGGRRNVDAPHVRYEAAKARALAAHNVATPIIAAPATFSEDDVLAALQEFASAFLQLRNSLPLTAVELQNPSGGAAMDPIREHESGDTPLDVDEIREALWKHLDRRAVATIARHATTNPQAPGIGAARDRPARRERVVDIVRSHLASMKATYPNSYETASLGSAESVQEYLESLVEHGLRESWIERLTTAITTDALPELAPGAEERTEGVTMAAPDKAYAVALVATPVGPNLVVNDLEVGGRPERVFFGSQQGPGSHTSAWVLLGDYVRGIVRNKNLATAYADLVLAGDAAVGDADGNNRIAAMPRPFRDNVAIVRQRYATAKAATAGPLFERVQALASAVLGVLNAQPLSTALGGRADSANEPRHRKRARTADTPGAAFGDAEAAEVRAALWGLLDDDAVARVMAPDADRMEIPGTLPDESIAERGADVVRRHLTFVRGAYPNAAARSSIGSLASVIGKLRQAGIDRDSIIAAAAAVCGVDLLAAGVEYQRQAGSSSGGDAKKKRRGKKDESEDEWSEGDEKPKKKQNRRPSVGSATGTKVQ